MSEQTANLCTTDACESLRQRLAKYEDAEGRPVVVVPEQAKEALDWIEDFIARCNGDDRGSCDSVNVLRTALESQAREIERLKAWKSEEMEVMTPLLDYARSVCTGPLGCSITEWLVSDHKRLAALKAQPGGVDERASFEAWYLGHFYMGDKQSGLEWLSTEPCGGYRHQHPAEQWIVWQARAALSAPSYAQDAGEVVAYWSDFSMVSVRFGDRVRTYVESCAPSHGEQVREVVPDLANLKADSARYQFLKENCQQDVDGYRNETPVLVHALSHVSDWRGRIDESIDAAISAPPSAGSQKEKGE